MQGIVNAVKGTAIGVAGYLTPVLKVRSWNLIKLVRLELFVCRPSK